MDTTRTHRAISVRLPVDLADALEARAEAEDSTVSRALRVAVRKWLEVDSEVSQLARDYWRELGNKPSAGHITTKETA